jgi:AraC-like DNA-binding protein
MISRFDSGDSFDEAAALFSASYDLPRFVSSPSAKRFTWSARVTGDARLTFRSIRFMANVETTFGLDGQYVVLWVREGELVMESSRSFVEFPIGIPVILPDSRSPMRVRGTDLDLSLVQIDASFLRGVAEELDDVSFLSFRPGPPESAHALKAWRRTIDLAAVVVMDPDAAPNSLLREEMSRLVALAMMTTFPYESTARAPGSGGIEPDSVRVAIEYANQNAHLPIGPSDLAGAAGLSARSLQTALRRYRDTTPSALIQGVRLQRVNTELANADFGTTSVAAVAHTWGFVHLGRFAGSYRRLFGESPNETLRRRPPA